MSVQVSIIVPVFNSEDFIEECLDSIISQNFFSFEVLVSDDCSRDSTRNILERYKNNSSIRIFFQEKNLGITQNCNFLLSKALGNYICFFAGDDIMLPNKIQKQFAYMESNPKCSFCYHPVDVFDSSTGANLLTTNSRSRFALKNSSQIIEKMGIPASMSIMARSSMLPRHGFSDNFKYVSDWLMQIELSMAGDVGFIENVLCRYRKYSANNGKDISIYESEFSSMLDYVAKKYPTLSTSCKVGKSRYLLGKFFRVASAKERRIVLLESIKIRLSLLSVFLLFFSFLPFSNSLFTLLYRKRYFLKGSA